MSNSVDEDELLKLFEEMLEENDEDDFGHYFPPSFVNHPNIPDAEDLEYPDEPPPLPEKVVCKHKKKRKVIISNNLKYWYCPDCDDDVGDIE